MAEPRLRDRERLRCDLLLERAQVLEAMYTLLPIERATVFLADSEAAYFWASIGCFAAFKLLNAVMAPCCIHQINSLQKVLMEQKV